MAGEVGISYGPFQTILTEDLGIRLSHPSSFHGFDTGVRIKPFFWGF
jgi:hypothetical protein